MIHIQIDENHIHMKLLYTNIDIIYNNKPEYTDIYHYNIIVITVMLNSLSFIHHPRTNLHVSEKNIYLYIYLTFRYRDDIFFGDKCL